MLQRCIWALPLILGLGSLALTQPPATQQSTTPRANDGDSNRISELIQKLGSAKFQDRSAAQKELEAIGVPALEQLKKSVASADLETSKRAGELVRKIEDRILTAGLLAPLHVHLQITDQSAKDAVSALAKLSGYSIQLATSGARGADTKITLDTGKVTFWEALDQLCAAAGLIEQIQPTAPRAAAQAGVFLVQGQGGAVPPPVQVPLPAIAVPSVGNQPPQPLPTIILLPGVAKNQYVSYAGSIRSRIRPQPGKTAKKADEYRLILEASAEPRLGGFSIVGMPTVDKAIDDLGQQLSLRSEPIQEDGLKAKVLPALPGGAFTTIAMASPQLPRQVTLSLKPGEKPAKSLKELSGTFTAQVTTPPEELITLNNVLKAAGKSSKGKNGGMLKLNSIDKLPDGDYNVQIFQENPPSSTFTSNFAGPLVLGNGVVQLQQAVQIPIGRLGAATAPANTHGLPELRDANGNKFKIAQVPARRVNLNNGVMTQEMTIIFHGQDGVGEPDRLVVHGTRSVNITVPFSFQNVALE